MYQVLSGKVVYSFHPITREFVGLETAYESPLEPGTWLIPAHATEVPPPSGTRSRYDGSRWEPINQGSGQVARSHRDARRQAAERLSSHTDAVIEACYARERQLRGHLAALPDDVAVLDAFEPRALWNS